VSVAVRAGAQARGDAAPEGRKELPQEGETNARGGRRSRLSDRDALLKAALLASAVAMLWVLAYAASRGQGFRPG
jgi:hypothetical protein